MQEKDIIVTPTLQICRPMGGFFKYLGGQLVWKNSNILHYHLLDQLYWGIFKVLRTKHIFGIHMWIGVKSSLKLLNPDSLHLICHTSFMTYVRDIEYYFSHLGAVQCGFSVATASTRLWLAHTSPPTASPGQGSVSSLAWSIWWVHRWPMHQAMPGCQVPMGTAGYDCLPHIL